MKKNICVFCSSSDVLDKIYYETASSVGHQIVANNDVLLYGGAKVGMMEKIAEKVNENKGKIIGIIPQKISHLASKNADELIVTSDMHSRKAKLEEKADAFIALPGGFGTLEELSEVLTLKHLGYHNKPIVILNVNGFYNSLIAFYETLYIQKFAKSEYQKYYFIAETTEDAFRYIENYKVGKAVSKWF